MWVIEQAWKHTCTGIMSAQSSTNKLEQESNFGARNVEGRFVCMSEAWVFVFRFEKCFVRVGQISVLQMKHNETTSSQDIYQIRFAIYQTLYLALHARMLISVCVPISKYCWLRVLSRFAGTYFSILYGQLRTSAYKVHITMECAKSKQQRRCSRPSVLKGLPALNGADRNQGYPCVAPKTPRIAHTVQILIL